MKADKEVRLRLIETSDVHGNYLPYDFIAKHRGLGGLSRVATYVSAQRDSLGEQQVVLLDNGEPLVYKPLAVQPDLTGSPYEKTAGARSVLGQDLKIMAELRRMAANSLGDSAEVGERSGNDKADILGSLNRFGGDGFGELNAFLEVGVHLPVSSDDFLSHIL